MGCKSSAEREPKFIVLVGADAILDPTILGDGSITLRTPLLAAAACQGYSTDAGGDSNPTVSESGGTKLSLERLLRAADGEGADGPGARHVIVLPKDAKILLPFPSEEAPGTPRPNVSDDSSNANSSPNANVSPISPIFEPFNLVTFHSLARAGGSHNSRAAGQCSASVIDMGASTAGSRVLMISAKRGKR